MNSRQRALTQKNLIHWGARIKKLQAKEALSGEEAEELEHRMAQVAVWKIELKREGPEAPATPGDISASAGAGTGESASVQ